MGNNLQESATDLPPEYGIIVVYSDRAFVHLHIGQFAEAIADISEALVRSRKLPDMNNLANILVHAGTIYEASGRYKEMKDAVVEACAIYEKLKLYKEATKAYHLIGFYHGIMGKLDLELEYLMKCVHYLEPAYEQAVKNGDLSSYTSFLATVYNNIGYVHAYKNDHVKASEFYQKSLEIRERINELHGIAQTLNNIGMIHARKGEFIQSLPLFERSLHLYLKTGLRKEASYSYINTARVFLETGESKKGLLYFRRALTIQREIGDIYGEATTLNNIAVFHSRFKREDIALKYFKRALSLYMGIGHKASVLKTMLNIAESYDLLCNWGKAYENYNGALELLEQMDNKPLQRKVLKAILDIAGKVDFIDKEIYRSKLEALGN